MSERKTGVETVADRVKELMASLPPAPGRKSRLGHISIEDFAAALGTGKQRVIDWRRGTGYPDAVNRERLATISGGRYSAEDFMAPTAAEKEDRLLAIEARLSALEAAVVDEQRLREIIREEIVAALARPHEDAA